jgi:hypothetical protein
MASAREDRKEVRDRSNEHAGKEQEKNRRGLGKRAPLAPLTGMMTTRSFSFSFSFSAALLRALLLVLVPSCGDGVGAEVARGDAGLDVPNDVDAAAPRPPTLACAEGATRGCACASGGTGLQTCRAGAYGACGSCDVSKPTKCVAGRYRGSFEMTYRSSPAGICGLTAQLEQTSAQGDWTFDLKEETVSTGEFATYVVNGGCLGSEGSVADSGAVRTPPIHAMLIGMVDCATGVLTGQLKGTYRATSVCDLGLVENNYFFLGTMTGTFDPATKSFRDGTMVWTEPRVLLPPQPGGSGAWNASLLLDAASPALPTDCLRGVTFRDDLFGDAGMPE